MIVGAGSGAPATPLDPIATSSFFSTTLGSQTYTLPAEATEGRWVVFLYATTGTNPTGAPSGWTEIFSIQRVGAWYKQIGAAETVVPAMGASNGYPHYAFMVFDAAIVCSDAYAGIFNTSGAQPINIQDGLGGYELATKTAVPVGSSVYGWTWAGNDTSAVPIAPATVVEENLTTFGSDSGATLMRQDGDGSDITLAFTGLVTRMAGSFVLAAA